MAAYYEQSVPISRLSAKSELASSDILLVSEYSVDSDSLYYTDKLIADSYGKMISAQFDISRQKDFTSAVSTEICAVSSDYLPVRNDFDSVYSAFLSNDAITRTIPALSVQKNDLSSNALSTLRFERVVQVEPDEYGRFYLSSFAVNECKSSGVSLVRFVIPPKLPGLSRHFTLRISSNIDAIPAFLGDRTFFTTGKLPARLSANVETFYDFKEIRPDGFYVRFGVRPASYEPDPDEVAIIYHSNYIS